MARRFQRSNYLFPQDLRPAQGEVVARPTDPFERASEGIVEQAPQRPFELPGPPRSSKLQDLSAALGLASQSLNDIGAQQYKEFTTRAESQGQVLAAQDELAGNKRSFRQLISQTRQENGGKAARELMGMSPHLKRGFDQTRARTAALSYNASIQSAYAANPEISEGVRLHDLDTSDPMYQNWLAQYQEQFEAENGVSTLDPTSQGIITTAQQDANTRVLMAHDELRSATKLREFEDGTANLVNTVARDLIANAEWISGNSPDSLLAAAEAISLQFDEANGLGYGGDDLEKIYALAVDQVIAAAYVSGNTKVLDLLEFVEVGPEDNRQKLMQGRRTSGEYRQAVDAARKTLVDREYQDGQRERQLRDQSKEDSQNNMYNQLARVAGLYDKMGRTPEAREAVEATLTRARAEASEFGYLHELNAIVPSILQDGSDNARVNLVNFDSLARLETDIQSRNITAREAKSRINQLSLSGDLGNGKQQADTMIRLNAMADGIDDRTFSEKSNAITTAAQEYRRIVTERMGLTQDERGRLTSIKDALHQGGFNDAQILTLTTMTQAELEQQIAANAEAAINNRDLQWSSSTIAAARTVVNEGINPLQRPEALDPADIQQEVLNFENEAYASILEFEEREGRPMRQDELREYLADHAQAYAVGHRARLPLSNPVSSRANRDYEAEIYSSTFQGIAEATGNPYKDAILDPAQLIKTVQYFSETGNWHPDFVSLAQRNSMTPDELLEHQLSANDVSVDTELKVSMGIPTQARATSAPTSVFAPRDIAKDYSPGQYTTFTKYFYDNYTKGKWDPGSYDFTFLQNGSDIVNVPAPFDGVVTRASQSAGGYGKLVEIRNPSNGLTYKIGHLDQIYLKEGDRFVKGQAIFKQGTSGNSSGPHLHVEILGGDGRRIINNKFTEPFIRDWISYVESGEFMKAGTASSSPSSTGGALFKPNGKAPLHGHAGYDVAPRSSLVSVGNYNGMEQLLQKPAADAFKRMVNDAKYEGITLQSVSAYRDYDEQKWLWERQLQRQGGNVQAAARLSAPPGHSQHHTGLAVDINSTSFDFENTIAFKWLQNNASRYGFSLGLSGDKYEPWQWVYGGQGGSGGPSKPSGTVTATDGKSRFFNSLIFLESTFDNTQPSSAGARGFIQAMPIFRKDLRQLGITDNTQSNDPKVAAETAWQWIKARRPEAARAIERGDLNTANRLLNDVWTSLPGGPESNQSSDRMRQFREYQQGKNLRFTF